MTFIDDYVAAIAADLDGQVVDHACGECGRRETTPANWTERPVCCSWEMVDLAFTLRPETAA